ncbi:glycosyltransferase family 4 protein [Cellulophaga fucicola]|uniref:Glycosyltransferase involved in cell wall bisynthesis n=1 Tax=Cellulophaga fucicola TaxID=76595 RepID=A0A1K1M421_9FLAO|nr:glycosyltransferase family 4 protein [Cellulophaga fucicola]SFW16710.1 Glycosyltransferase involved in cell wall bisynthesis [Cellulophaga fucicola]
MKLLYITNQICGSGGLERVLSIKASYLTENLNYDVHILTLNQGNTSLFYDFSEKITYHDVTAKGNPLQYFINYRKGIKEIIKKINPDVISVCDDGLKGLLLPYIIGKPCPMVYERHASKNIEIKKDNLKVLDQLKRKIMFKLMDIGAAKYDTFVVLTNGNTKEWNLQNMVVIPNPLSFFPEKEQLSSLANKNVLAVGNHGFQKGYDRLLQSWKIVLEKYPDWILNIYGKIDEDKKHIKLAEHLGISKNVFVHQPVKNIETKYKEASIYVMSSRSEGFGMVLIEAMAYGVPCISFDCPSGPKDIIDDKKDGFLIKNGDISTFSSKICSLIKDYDLRKKMGLNARIKSEKYLTKNIIPIWDTLFKGLS